MIFVLPIFVLGGCLVIALWWIFFRAAVRHESAVRAAKKREADFDRLLLTPEEPLHCLECRKTFPGPLEDDGCPHCHIRAFVIPARAHSDPSVAADGTVRKPQIQKIQRKPQL
jgi:hypothetical protein